MLLATVVFPDAEPPQTPITKDEKANGYKVKRGQMRSTYILRH